jgi:hypothetical protein
MHPLKTRVMLVCMGFLLAGCVTGFRGAPKPLFDPKLVESKEFADPTSLFNELVQASDPKERNKAISKLLALADVRYTEFRHNLVANKKHSGAATDMLLLAMNIAGGLTTSAGVKDNYLAGSALVHGGNTLYDKDYMFDQTLPALVAQMDANRRTKLLEIRTTMASQSIDEYPGQVALADILDYHQAGTLFGAVAGVHRGAAKQEAEAGDSLRELNAPTREEIAHLRRGSERFDQMVDAMTTAEQIDLQQFLLQRGIATATGMPTGALLKRWLAELYKKQFPGELDKLVSELEIAGFTVPD